MKFVFVLLAGVAINCYAVRLSAQTTQVAVPTFYPPEKNLYIDVHQLQPGKVKFEDVVKAHQRDLAVENKYGVDFLNFWVNEEKGLVYCLSASSDTASIRKTHAEAHGLLPEYIYQVTEGTEGTGVNKNGENNFFLDVHYLGAGKVTAKDVAAAHQKDLNTEHKYGVNFINYWLDEKNGIVMCLSQAKDTSSVIQTHKEAHGLVPAYIVKVKQGQ